MPNFKKNPDAMRPSGFKMKGFSGFGNSPMKQKQEHEGKKTMDGARLEELVTAGKVIDKPSTVDGGADYYYTMQDGKYKIHGDVDLEGGNVTGVPGNQGGKLTRRK